MQDFCIEWIVFSHSLVFTSVKDLSIRVNIHCTLHFDSCDTHWSSWLMDSEGSSSFMVSS